MNEEFSHLNHGVWSFLDDPDHERIRRCRSPLWVNYPRAGEALSRLDYLLDYPPRARMPCMLLFGDSDIGKSMIIEKFQRDNPDSFDEFNDIVAKRVMMVQMPSTPHERRFYSQIIRAYGQRTPLLRRNAADTEVLALRLLFQFRPKVIVVDEVHHLFAGPPMDQRQALNQLKFISNELRVSMVAVGTGDALHALQSDPQMASRFEPFPLNRWRENDAFRSFVAGFGRVLPLKKPSRLEEREFLTTLLTHSEGLTGRVASLLSRCAEHAIRSGKEFIDIGVLSEIIQRRLTSPEPIDAHSK